MAVAPTTLEGTALERVHKLTQVIREGGDEAQKLRRLPDETVDILINEGIFRFTLPHRARRRERQLHGDHRGP